MRPRTRFLSLTLSVQLQNNRALPLAFRFLLLAKIDGRQRYVRLGELRSLLHQSFQIGARAFQLPLGQFQRSDLIADAEISGADFESMLEKLQSSVVILV